MFLINPQNFQVGEIPKYHPASQKYLSFWRTQKKRCIEGYWSQGRWMPGKLYFYINFGTIKLNKKGSKVKSYGRPWLRDLEWEFFLNWEEARGFSGFSEDTEYTCLHSVKDLRDAGISVPTDYITRYHPEAIAPNGQLKKYLPPREYLRTVHPTSLGSPLHTNQARNLFMMGCHGKGTRVRMYDGSTKAVEDVQVGDKLLGPDGEPRVVQKLFYGLDDLYRIKQGKGNDYVVNSSHILHLENRFGQRINKPAEELISLKEHKGYIPNYKGIRSETIHYEDNPQLPIDAYFVGLWLGDGTKGTAIITTGDEEEILPHLRTLNSELSIYKDPDGKEDLNYCKINLKKPVKDQLEHLGILHDKHIPTVFMQVPYEQRMELLAGLLDSDGCLDNTAFDFYQKDYRLAKQVWELARSLGFFASITCSKSLYKVHITGEVTKIPTKISRKQATQDSNPYQTTTISIEPEGFGEYFGFEVDQDHLYLLEDFTITHNSRGYGKSYSVGVGIVAHEFLFDGQTIYDPEAPLTAAEIVMGAGDAKYSTETLDKTKTAIDHLPGALELNGVYYPNPFAKQFRGSWAPAKQIEAKYKKKVAGSWVTLGTGSNIKHRTFKDNPFAANGTRPGVMIWEEVGMFDNLKESYNASVECQRDGAYKFGSMMFLGTGGDMNGGGCLTGETKVWDSEGNLHQLKDLPTDKGIKGFNQQTQKVSNESISYWQSYTEKPCYRITTNSGRYIQASEEHPILYSKSSNFRQSKKVNGKRKHWKKVDWIETKDMQVGYQLAIADIIPIISTKKLKHARLLGLLIGDGSYTCTPVLSNNDADIWRFVDKHYKTSKKVERVCKDGSIYKECSILGIRDALRKMGILGQTREKKTLPKDIHSYDKESISNLLGGLFDADGCVLKDRISFASAHYSLVDEIRFLLQRLGIHCTIHKKTNKPNKLIKVVTEHYELQIRDKRSILRFFRNIEFISKIKQHKLLKLYTNTKKIRKHFSKELIGLRFETVTSIEEIGVHPVYNLTADTTNTYIGNGIVTHNTVDAQEIFYTPEQYDCVAFEDIWEHRGKIGYFVPAYMGLNQFKDENGHTDTEAAKKHLEETRNKYRKAKGSLSALEGEIVNRPLVPSEIFLQKQGNIFPVAELRQRLAKLEEHGRWAHLEKKVELFYDSEVKVTNGVTYKIDTRNKLQAINRFPWKENSREGAVVIYEFPELVDNKVPTGAYIIGHDPYAQDDEGESCAVTIVMKTKKYFSSIGHDEVVAIHVARPYDGRHVVNETLYKLSLFYGEARIYFENVRGNVKEFFEKKKRLDLLAKQPTTVMSKKASYNSSSNVIYGYPMSSKQMKIEGIQYVRDWLLEERKDENDNVIRNLDRIWDRALLQELIAFNMDGNFDRVMALIGCVIGMEETHNKYMEQTENKRIRDEATTFLANNRSMFPNATPEQYLHTTTNNYEWIN